MRASHRCDGPRNVEMPPLQLGEVSTQPHGQLVIGDRQHDARAVKARNLRDRPGKLHRIAERPDTEHSRRSTVQHHPVLDVLGVEKLPPSLSAHVDLPRGT